jgi:hypothetical protein
MRFRPTRSKRNAKDDLDPALPCFNIAMQRAFRKPSMLFHQAQAMQHARADVARPAELPRLPKTSVTLQVNAKTKQRNKPNQNVIANLNSSIDSIG